jgi:hypothetical protein
MSIQIYKPNSKVTGCALSLQASDRDGKLYVNMIKQASWNPETKKGSFIENRNDPTKKTVLKFSQVEAAQIIDCVERHYQWSGFHDSASKTTGIVFAPNDERSVFSLSVNQTDKQDSTVKSQFFIPLTYAEVRLIKEYLIHYLHKSFKMKTDSRPANQEQEVRQPEAQEEQPVEQPVEEPTDKW